jgi:hypothetical protein
MPFDQLVSWWKKLPFVAALRKPSHYLLALSPPVERAYKRARSYAPRALRAAAARCAAGHPGAAKKAKAAGAVFRHFWWSDYSGNRVEWGLLPPDAAPLLRLALAAAFLLCLSLPFAISYPCTPPHAVALGCGRGPVAAWWIWLWIAAFSLGWGCMLSGAARSNRAAVLVVSPLYLFYTGQGATAVPRTAVNLLLPLAVLVTLYASERTHGRDGAGGRARWVPAAIAGGLSGFAIAAFTPLKGIVPGGNPLVGAIPGAALGLLLRRFARRGGMARPGGPALPVRLVALATGGATLLFMGNLALRGGAAVPANAILGFLVMWTGFLWPAFYFAGVGIVWKILKSAQVLSRAAEEIVPPRAFAAACALVFAGGNLLLWAPLVLDTGALRWPAPAVNAAAGIYRWAAPWLWNDWLRATAALQLRWVLLFDAAALAWCAATRRLSAKTLSSLLFGTLLAWFCFSEYLAQSSAFLRANSRTATEYFFFGTATLWILYSNGAPISVRSSRSWPAAGRLALFGAVLLFLVLGVHARAATGEERVRFEVVMSCFLGIIDAGIPYALFIYADRRACRFPRRLPLLFGAFCFGIALTLPLSALDKVVAAGGSFAALKAALHQRFEAVCAGAPAAGPPPPLPAWWIAARGALALGALASFAAAAVRGEPDRASRRPLLILSIVASSVGLASFAKSSAFTELPLVSPRWSLLFSPLVPSLDLDANAFALYLTYALPALALAIALTGRGETRAPRRCAGVAAAWALYLAAAWAWPWREAWLRSTGLLATGGIAGLGLALLLFREVRRRVEGAMPPGGDDGGGAPVVGPGAARVLACAAAAVLAALALFQASSGKFVPRAVPGLSRPLPLPAAWDALGGASPAAGAAFARRSAARPRPFLFAVPLKEGAGGAAPALSRVEADAKANLRGCDVFKREAWDRFLPGARALDYSFTNTAAGGAGAPFMATAAFLPVPGGGAVLLTLVDAPESWQTRRWDLVRIAEEMGRGMK